MEDRNYKLYVHISPSNKRYIGITSEEDVKRRWLNGAGYRTQQYFYRAINKYGWENFKHIVLFSNLIKEEACLLEQCYIALYDTMNPKYGYNSTSGGEHYIPSERTRKKLSIANTGKHHTEETKRKISKIKKGSPGYWTGKQLSMETRNKISEAHKGLQTGEKHPLYGKHRTEETKKKISKSLKGVMAGENNPMYGKHFTEEHRRKLSQSHKGIKMSEENKKKLSKRTKGKKNPNAKSVLMFTLDGKFIRRFECVADANEYLGKPRNRDNIGACARGEQETSFGYKWIYEEDYIKEQEQVI